MPSRAEARPAARARPAACPRGRLIPVLLLVVPLLGGCLFEPREAEPPASTDPIPYVPQTSARNVWSNVELALNNTDVAGWDQNLSSDFRYVPDSQTESAYPTVDWANWDKSQEIDFVQSWFGSDITIVSDMIRDGSQNTNDPGGQFGTWDLIYLVRVTDQFGGETRYSGRAEIDFQLEGNFWYITRWEDLNGEEDPDNPGSNLQTLGVVRGAIASQ
jgi:hypothetical protein